MHITLTPAYGRNYKTAADASAAWAEGKDFAIATPGIPGRYCGINDKKHLLADGFTAVRIRFAKLTKSVDINL